MKPIEEVLNEFLRKKDPCVIAIKGPWGVGKTYFWNHYFEKQKGSIALTAYS